MKKTPDINMKAETGIKILCAHIGCSQEQLSVGDLYLAELIDANTALAVAEAAKEAEEDVIRLREYVLEVDRLANLKNDELKLCRAQYLLLSDALCLAEIASCSCRTKTNDASYHSDTCLYRTFTKALAATKETIESFRNKLYAAEMAEAKAAGFETAQDFFTSYKELQQQILELQETAKFNDTTYTLMSKEIMSGRRKIKELTEMLENAEDLW